ncbi:MAG: c-type cytochrome [Candidatus Sumerlaeia bacterium]|nr:c-type cytochrome [Candidatus Sumerlaeia bacterium]
MSAPTGGAPKRELSSILAFVGVTGVAIYVIFFISAWAFDYGAKKGVVQRQIDPPKLVEEDKPARVFDYRELRKPTPELVALGKKVYSANCATCHGDDGYGDGAAGQRLAAKPRNFHTTPPAEYKNGAATLRVYDTLKNGVGGAMPAFPLLDPEQKFAVAHYIHTWMPEVPEDDPDAVASLPAPTLDSGAAMVVADTGPRVSIDFAIASLAQPDPARWNRPVKIDVASARTLGERIYLANCASCHGASGEGGIPYGVVNYVPKITLRARPLSEPAGGWLGDRGEFVSIVTEGTAGKMKPGFGLLTREEMDALYDHVRGLATGKLSASTNP